MPRDRIEAMARTLAHRGPDDSGVFEAADGRVALAHRRLSILDTSPAGHQPMTDASGRFTIVYNGEIYGFRALRESLEARGHRFRSGSDTEVILAAYSEWGSGCLERLDGMFAFAIWDDQRQSLFAARDRLGIKPLYYYWDGDSAILASELRALLVHPAVSAEVDVSALRDFLVYGFVPDPKSIIRRIHKLPPGCQLTLTDGDLQVRPWWDLVFAEDDSRSEDQWCEALLACLDRAVSDQLVSDVPLGAFLSGGLDSSAIVSSIVAAGVEKPRVFSVGFPEARFNELPHARKVCESLDIDLVETVVTADSLHADLSLIAEVYDEPVGDQSVVPTYHLCGAARRIVTVALSGDGGDENFGGYRSYARAYARAVGRPTGRVLLDRLLGSIRGRGVEPEDPLDYFRRRSGDWPPEHVERLVPGRDPDEDPFWAYDAAMQDGLDPINQVLRIGLKMLLPGRMLTKMDRASMAHSLEVRVPLLDHRLVEMCARIPAPLKLGGGDTKVVFKRALAGRLPEEIIHRRKQGFTPPLRRWLVEPSTYASLRASLESNPLVRDLFDARALRSFLDAPSRKRLFGRRFADLVFLDRWSRRWLRLG